jgi:transposase
MMWTAEHHKNASRKGLRYPSDLTENEWRLVETFIPPARHGGRKRHVNFREVLNSLSYVLATGCQWSALPKDLAPKSTAHDHFIIPDRSSALKRIHEALYIAAREQAGKEASPTAPIIDSQSAKAVQKGALDWTRKAMTRVKRSPDANATSASTRSVSC